VNVCRITGLSPSDVRALTAGELIAWIGAELGTTPGPRVAFADEIEGP
jgi:hypothetical protein